MNPENRKWIDAQAARIRKQITDQFPVVNQVADSVANENLLLVLAWWLGRQSAKGRVWDTTIKANDE
jgi:hypothetical protein